MFFYSAITGLGLTLLVCLIIIILMSEANESEGYVSVFECGFDVKCGSRIQFSYRFFLLAILFIVFDVEISLMLPVPYLMFSMLSAWLFYSFILVLLVGCLYELFEGSLDWIN